MGRRLDTSGYMNYLVAQGTPQEEETQIQQMSAQQTMQQQTQQRQQQVQRQPYPTSTEGMDMVQTSRTNAGLDPIQLQNAKERAKIGTDLERQGTLAPGESDKNKQSQIDNQDLKREIFGKDLESFLAIDDVMQEARGNGLGRIGAGINIAIQGFKQDSTLGRAAATHDAGVKRLRVQLVRAAGDVGNINIVEQKAAEALIPTKFDDKGTAKIKRAYLRQIGKAINDGSANEVKKAINSFMNTDEYLKEFVIVKDKKTGKVLHIPREQYSDYKKDRGL